MILQCVVCPVPCVQCVYFPARVVTRHVSSCCPGAVARYCECFASNRVCTDACNCSGCCNHSESDPLRKQAIMVTLERNPHAFRPKVLPEEVLDDPRESPAAVAANAMLVRRG